MHQIYRKIELNIIVKLTLAIYKKLLNFKYWNPETMTVTDVESINFSNNCLYVLSVPRSSNSCEPDYLPLMKAESI